MQMIELKRYALVGSGDVSSPSDYSNDEIKRISPLTILHLIH